ncbi:MAG: purine-nucleoside phosphorylase [Actinomycetota bacterium]|nr:purine-nucleoside phosphorylase [Actinomycetota bacterium]MDH5224349.1 purine-nucleoside phosphorylase [Actinomycetota bacterium]MDH5314272.1 purine-nucleoside phosphorylase [Actinomycetota bacterium]
MNDPGLPGPGDDLAVRAASAVRAETDLVPRVGVVLGSGLGPALGEALEETAAYPFTNLPGFPPSGVPGHAGKLVLGHLAGVPVAAFFGRVHFYEGHGMDVPALLPRLAKELGADTMVLTAAVGGLLPGEPAGTVVILRDHINMMGTAPLRGWRYPDGMPTFISAAEVYDEALRELAFERAQSLGIPSSIGVYAAMSGPAYETPTEVRVLQATGATVVGMSMVPEALPATALQMRVLGICSLTNAFGEHVEHEEVVRVSNETAVAVGRLLLDLLPRM